MDLGSIENSTKHIMNVGRIESDLGNLSPEEIDHKLDEKILQATIRWEACLKSYAMLFMMLNRGNRNKMPVDSFEVHLKHEELDDVTYDTYVKVWRDRNSKTYHVKPFVDCGYGIIDNEFETETFGDTYEYSHGTHHNKFARVKFEHDGAEPHVRLDRVDGRQMGELNIRQKAIFLAALDGSAIPSIDESECSISMITNAVLDDALNPELAKRARLPER